MKLQNECRLFGHPVQEYKKPKLFFLFFFFSCIKSLPWWLFNRTANHCPLSKSYLSFPLVNLFWHHVFRQMRHENSWRWKTLSSLIKRCSHFRREFLCHITSWLSKIKLHRGGLPFAVDLILIPIVKYKINNFNCPMRSYELSKSNQQES